MERFRFLENPCAVLDILQSCLLKKVWTCKIYFLRLLKEVSGGGGGDGVSLGSGGGLRIHHRGSNF